MFPLSPELILVLNQSVVSRHFEKKKSEINQRISPEKLPADSFNDICGKIQSIQYVQSFLRMSSRHSDEVGKCFEHIDDDEVEWKLCLRW